GRHYSSDCQTKNQLVYEPSPSNNYDFPYFDQPPQYHIDQSPPHDLVFDSLMRSHRETNHILEELLRIPMPNPLVVPKDKGPSDIPLVISSLDFNDNFTLCNDNPLFDEEFEDISSLDPPELTPVIDEPTLLVTPPLPCTDVLGDAIVDIDLLLGEQLDTLSTGDREINFNPIRDIEEL
ncbi:hypothetical protein Tco_1494813, partial [Tanacetum coccineum]